MDLAELERRVAGLEGWQQDLEHNVGRVPTAGWVNEIEGRLTALAERVEALENRAGRRNSQPSVNLTGTPLHGNWQSLPSWPGDYHDC